MRMAMALAAALLLAARAAPAAGPVDFESVVDQVRPPDSEDRAVQGFTLVDAGGAGVRAVGVVGRAYSVSNAPGNTLWGLVSEAVNLPAASGHIVGIESGIANMNPANAGELRGIDVVFKDRGDANLSAPVPVVGANGYNERSAAIYVSSQPRSSAGEYSGWQSGIKFDRHSLDRSVSIPYAAAVDVSEVEVPATFYLIVWRCGEVKCGLKPTGDGAVVVRDIEHLP